MTRLMSSAKAVEFKLSAPSAKKVSIAGSFNSWDPNALPAKKDTKGNWKIKTTLKSGRYEYKFFVDGNWISDPKCKSYAYNPFGTQNCIIEVK